MCIIIIIIYCYYYYFFFWQTLGVKTGFNKSPMELKAVRQQEESWLEDKEERDVVSPWDVPPVIRRILGLDSQAKEQV